MTRHSVDPIRRWLIAAIAPLFLPALASCGGGGGDDEPPCRLTGTQAQINYSPGVRTPDGPIALSYSKGVAQTWTMRLVGVTAACASQMRVTAAVGALPDGYTLDSSTGAITRAVNATGQAGFCNTTALDPPDWVDGVCPAGSTPYQRGYAIRVEGPFTPPDAVQTVWFVQSN